MEWRQLWGMMTAFPAGIIVLAVIWKSSLPDANDGTKAGWLGPLYNPSWRIGAR